MNFDQNTKRMILALVRPVTGRFASVRFGLRATIVKFEIPRFA